MNDARKRDDCERSERDGKGETGGREIRNERSNNCSE